MKPSIELGNTRNDSRNKKQQTDGYRNTLNGAVGILFQHRTDRYRANGTKYRTLQYFHNLIF